MSDTTADAGPQDEQRPQSGNAAAASAPADERLAYRGVFQRMLIRPEIGAAIGAIAIWVFFWAVSVPFGKAGGAASILDVASSPLGIMAVAVAMLMIGGEFDLSTGAATGAFGILLQQALHLVREARNRVFVTEIFGGNATQIADLAKEDGQEGIGFGFHSMQSGNLTTVVTARKCQGRVVAAIVIAVFAAVSCFC